jgi:hypothetical protein
MKERLSNEKILDEDISAITMARRASDSGSDDGSSIDYSPSDDGTTTFGVRMTN